MSQRRTKSKAKPGAARAAPRKPAVKRQPREPRASQSPGWLGPLLGAAGSGLGTALLGPGAGTLAGATAGNMLGQGIRYATGFGDYEIHDNVLVKEAVTGAPIPIINPNKHGGTCIRHREFLGDIITASTNNTFKLQSFAINPANQYTFPWLSQIASNYEQYSLEGVIFEYRSMSADALNSTNTALGSVIMATNYNAGAPNFTQKVEMENYEFGVSCKPSVGMMHPIECEARRTSITELYTRAGAVPAGQDIRLYDWGNFQIATSGFQGTNVNIGELWVSYQVCLLKPKMYTSLGSFNDIFARRCGSYSVGLPFGSYLNEYIAYNSLGAQAVVDSASFAAINLPYNNISQSYIVRFTWLGTSPSVLVYPVISLLNAAFGTIQPLDAIPTASTSSNYASQEFSIVTNGNGNMARILVNSTSAVFPTGTTNSYIRIYQIDNGAINAQTAP